MIRPNKPSRQAIVPLVLAIYMAGQSGAAFANNAENDTPRLALLSGTTLTRADNRAEMRPAQSGLIVNRSTKSVQPSVLATRGTWICSASGSGMQSRCFAGR